MEFEKIYLQYLPVILECFEGLFLFNCNYDFNDYSFSSPFYTELLQWWSKFCDEFAEENKQITNYYIEQQRDSER